MFQENSIKTCILSRVKQITSPGWMHETSARTWCTGKTQRDRVEREVGGGSGWGTHVNPWLFHFNIWQNPLQIKKNKLRMLRWGHSHELSGWASIITKMLLKVRQEGMILWQEMWWKSKERIISQGTQALSRSCKKSRKQILPSEPQSKAVLPTLWFRFLTSRFLTE